MITSSPHVFGVETGPRILHYEVKWKTVPLTMAGALDRLLEVCLNHVWTMQQQMIDYVSSSRAREVPKEFGPASS